MPEAECLARKIRIDTRLRGMTPPWNIIRYRDGLDISALRRPWRRKRSQEAVVDDLGEIVELLEKEEGVEK
jgi:hypothetical protein